MKSMREKASSDRPFLYRHKNINYRFTKIYFYTIVPSSPTPMGDAMSELPEIPANPALSPGFDKARRLSRLLVVLFTIGFWLGVLFLVGLTIYAACLAFWPALIELVVSASRRPPPPEATAAAMAIVFVAMLPCLAALHYARRLFSSFAVGEIFTVHAIGLMRTTALWLVVAGVVPPRPLVLVIGMAAYVAAYVMAEARRLADESASFV